MTNKELTETVEKQRKEIATLNQNLTDRWTELKDALESNSQMERRWNTKSWRDLLKEVHGLKELASNNREHARNINQSMATENAKLWYMMRIAMGDDSAKIPKDHNQLEPILHNPHWDV